MVSIHNLVRYWLAEFFNMMDKFPRYMNVDERKQLLQACVPWIRIH